MAWTQRPFLVLAALGASALYPGVCTAKSRALGKALRLSKDVTAHEGTTVSASAKAEPEAAAPFLLRLAAFLGPSGSSRGTTVAAGSAIDMEALGHISLSMFLFYGANTFPKAGDRDQSGGFYHLAGHLPLSWGPIRIVPKLGVGVGLWNAGFEQFDGIYALVGSELRWETIGFHVAYYQGASGSVTLTQETAPNVFTNSASAGSRFGQVRLGFYYRFSPQLRLGTDYLHSRFAGTGHSQLFFPIALEF